jgi:predicted transcriptional regulator
MEKKFVQVDTETGEILENGFMAYVVPKRKNGFDRWCSMSQDAMVWICRESAGNLAKMKLNTTDYRVLICLLAHLDYENHILVPQSEMAEKIGIARSHFSNSVKKLISFGIIERGPKIGRMVSLKVNPEYAWKGSAKNHVVALDSDRKARMKKANITGVIDTQERDEKTID